MSPASEPPVGALVRRRRGTLHRLTADGYLLHAGAGVVRISGLDAEVWGQVEGEVSVGRLIDLGADAGAGAADVLASLGGLQRQSALELVTT